MKTVNKGTKKYDEIVWKWEHCNCGDSIEKAYRTKPSTEKMRTFKDIWFRATQTKGYNHDLKVVSASCWFYSTMYSFTLEDKNFLVYDTPSNTFILEY